ncbi:MAG TPA: TIGR01212 family radical SAM protein [Sumerlaeia bacterium]|nr:TIGR01212 family radical SAM protein [Sumerlaeia bacterium]
MAKQAKPPMPPFPGGKRYAALGPALRGIFGQRVRRVPLDAGFTCPTRDGTLGTGGCLYCDAEGSRAARVDPDLPAREQLRRGIERELGTARAGLFIAYFQAFTSTYAPPEALRAAYEEGLSDPRVAAMAIGARPDCLAEPILDVLADFAHRTFLWVEVGLQSARDATLEAVCRGHSVADFIDAARRLRARGLRFCAHVIFGLPGDGRDDMLAAAPLLNDLGAWGVKLHNLYIHKHSPMAQLWRRGEAPLLPRDEYLELVVEFLARLSPDVLIHRLVGEAPRNRLLAPEWTKDKRGFLNDLDRRLAALDLWQGKWLESPGALTHGTRRAP